MNWKRFVRKESWPNVRCCPSIFLDGLGKTTKKPQ